MVPSRSKDILTDVSVEVSIGAGAVIGEAREVIAADQPKVVLDGVFVIVAVGAEPRSESGGAARDTRSVRIGVGGEALGNGGGIIELRLLLV